MASACVNNIGLPADNFPVTFPSYGWLSPRISLSRDLSEEEPSKVAGAKLPATAEKQEDAREPSDPDATGKEFGDFEFRPEDPVTMLPADELFSDGKLVPLQHSMVRPALTRKVSSEIRSPDTPKAFQAAEVSSTDPHLFSPKAPRCSSRWKEILGLKRLYLNNIVKQDKQKTTSSSSSLPSHICNNSKSLKHFLHRSSKSSNSTLDSSMSLPLLKDLDSESVSIFSRLSLSSSSSSYEYDDLPRLSLDSDKPNSSQNTGVTISKNPNPNSNLPKVKVVKHRALSSENPTTIKAGRSPLHRAPDSTTSTVRGVSVDSPRMNSSGKIVFQGLERSSSSPSSLNGGPRFKHRGMERSYSANVRISPVLNVPFCSLMGSSKSSVFGFQLFSYPQKREGGGGNGGNRGQQSSCKSRTDRA
ncbi:hypothetical protein U1Q18_000151 [Sarracenia purpurea var. burkii]